MQTVRITTSQNIDIDYQMAGLGDRIAARMIDYAIFYALLVVCMMIFLGISASNSGTNPFEGIGYFIMIGIWLVMCVFYDVLTEVFMNGQTLGKRAMKIRVISLSGARPGVGQYILRWLFRFIDFLMSLGTVAVFCVTFSDKKQRVGDMVANTVLVRTEPKSNTVDLVFSPAPDDYVPTYPEVLHLTDRDITLIHDVIRNFNRTRNSTLVFKLAMRLKAFLNISYPMEINEYQFLELVLNDYNCLVTKGTIEP